MSWDSLVVDPPSGQDLKAPGGEGQGITVVVVAPGGMEYPDVSTTRVFVLDLLERMYQLTVVRVYYVALLHHQLQILIDVLLGFQVELEGLYGKAGFLELVGWAGAQTRGVEVKIQ